MRATLKGRREKQGDRKREEEMVYTEKHSTFLVPASQRLLVNDKLVNFKKSCLKVLKM
jgi:hypothetical protein